MKILILANSDMGLYKFRKELLEVFKEKKYEVYVSFPHGNMQQEIELLTDKIIYTDIDRRGTNVIKDFFLLIKYIFLIKKINPDFVLTYTIKPNLYGGIASAINKKPFIMNITGLGSAFLKTGLVKKIIINLYKFVLPNSKCVFFQNSFDQDSILKLKLKLNNYKLLPGSGVNLKEYSYMEYPPSDDVIKILFIGRIIKEKGIEELIEAIKIIKQKRKNIQIDVVGPCDIAYRKKITSWVDEGLIVYHGLQKNVKPFYKASHVLVNPSYSEGMSNVCLEAGASGRPIIVSKIPGCLEIFDENISGFGFTSGNVGEMVIALEKFISIDYNEKKNMGLMLRKKIESNFSREIIIRKYLDEMG